MASEEAKRRFREIVAPRLDDAFSLAFWISGSPSDAEDIVQEAAIRALLALEAVDIASPRAWWLRIVRNSALTFMRRHRSNSLSYVGDLVDLEACEDVALSEPGADAEASLVATQDAQSVRQAVAKLPSPLRETLVMREVNEMSYREIATAMEAPIGTVMSRLARARAALARTLRGAA